MIEPTSAQVAFPPTLIRAYEVVQREIESENQNLVAVLRKEADEQIAAIKERTRLSVAQIAAAEKDQFLLLKRLLPHLATSTSTASLASQHQSAWEEMLCVPRLSLEKQDGAFVLCVSSSPRSLFAISCEGPVNPFSTSVSKSDSPRKVRISFLPRDWQHTQSIAKSCSLLPLASSPRLLLSFSQVKQSGESSQWTPLHSDWSKDKEDNWSTEILQSAFQSSDAYLLRSPKLGLCPVVLSSCPKIRKVAVSMENIEKCVFVNSTTLLLVNRADFATVVDTRDSKRYSYMDLNKEGVKVNFLSPATDAFYKVMPGPEKGQVSLYEHRIMSNRIALLDIGEQIQAGFQNPPLWKHWQVTSRWSIGDDPLEMWKWSVLSGRYSPTDGSVFSPGFPACYTRSQVGQRFVADLKRRLPVKDAVYVTQRGPFVFAVSECVRKPREGQGQQAKEDMDDKDNKEKDTDRSAKRLFRIRLFDRHTCLEVASLIYPSPSLQDAAHIEWSFAVFPKRRRILVGAGFVSQTKAYDFAGNQTFFSAKCLPENDWNGFGCWQDRFVWWGGLSDLFYCDIDEFTSHCLA